MKRVKRIRNKRGTLKSWLRSASPYLKRMYHIEGVRLRLTENRLARQERAEDGPTPRQALEDLAKCRCRCLPDIADKTSECEVPGGGFDHDFEWIDDSFDHEFGTEVCGHWECTDCGAVDEKREPPYGDDFDDNFI